jgi:addiction module RelE/StbE family toxin
MRKRASNLRIDFSHLFNQQRNVAPLPIKIAFREALELFLADPFHPALRNHALQEKFSGYRSIDVTSDWRAIYRETRTGEVTVIVFVLLGTHEKLYG